MRDSLETPYDTLEVSRTASQEVIRAAYRLLVQRYHPDRNPGDHAAADRTQRLNDAYKLVSDPHARADYDSRLAAAQNRWAGDEEHDADATERPTEPPNAFHMAVGAAAMIGGIWLGGYVVWKTVTWVWHFAVSIYTSTAAWLGSLAWWQVGLLTFGILFGLGLVGALCEEDNT